MLESYTSILGVDIFVIVMNAENMHQRCLRLLLAVGMRINND